MCGSQRAPAQMIPRQDSQSILSHVRILRSVHRFACSSPFQALGTMPPFSSSFRGVSWSKHYQQWVAAICRKGLDVHLGGFDDEVEAAKAYDK
jgi:hypothetical protein